MDDSGALGPGLSAKEQAAEYRRLGKAAFDQGDYARAEDLYRRATAAFPRDLWAWLWVARTLQRRGDREGALTTARRALDLKPGWPAAADLVAELLAAEGNTAEAVATLGGIAITGDTQVSGLQRVLRRLHTLGADVEAGQLAETVLRSGAVGDASAASVAAGAVVVMHLALGKPQDALAVLEQNETCARDPALLERVAQELWNRGHVTEASAFFDRALATRPTDERLVARQRAVRSEAKVLRGEWHPPELRVERGEPVPGRVLHVVGRSLPYYQAGYSIRTQSIARAQRQTGFDPHVVTQLGFPWNIGIEAPVDESVDGISHHRLPPVGDLPDRVDVRLSRHARGLSALVQELRPAVLHAASDYLNPMVALPVGRAHGVPVVYEVRGLWEETWLSKRDAESIDSELYQLRRQRELDAMLRSDAVVTLSDGMRAELVARGVPPAKIAIVPNAVDVDVFVPVGRDAGLASELGIAEDEVVLGYISSLSHYEGVTYLIEAIARLAAQGQPVRGLIVGEGSDRSALETRAAALGLGNRVIFTGRVPHDEVLRYYGLIDVFVIPRTADRVSQLVTPLKPFEAMATGRAVVVSGVDALREMVIEGETGLTFRPEDPEHLVSVVLPLIAGKERREALGRAARAWVCAHRTWTQNGLRYLELYRELGVRLPEGIPSIRIA